MKMLHFQKDKVLLIINENQRELRGEEVDMDIFKLLISFIFCF